MTLRTAVVVGSLAALAGCGGGATDGGITSPLSALAKAEPAFGLKELEESLEEMMASMPEGLNVRPTEEELTELELKKMDKQRLELVAHIEDMRRKRALEAKDDFGKAVLEVMEIQRKKKSLEMEMAVTSLGDK